LAQHPEAVKAFWGAQPAQVRDLVAGYAAGYNRYLAERREQGLPQQCQGEWVRDIAAEDLVKLTRRLLVEGGVGQFAEALAGATPPQATAQLDSSAKAYQLADARLQRFALDRGSNAVAVGSERSFNGRGMLLANPHFPWVGGMRFYQMHLTIPGKLDVMGAALPGLPMINIGFNQHLAWTHTVDSSKHFTLYRLQLDPKDPTRYLLDGNRCRWTSRPSPCRSNRRMAKWCRFRAMSTARSSARLFSGRANSTGIISTLTACATPIWTMIAC
jgi:acyl-homoserine-lactone acylase